MRIYLAKTLEGIGMYGPIYDLGTGVPERVEEYVMSEEEQEWLLDNLVDSINATCDTLLDDGDYDYINADKCKDLVNMIDKLPESCVKNQFASALKVLRDYAIRAIEYNTGIAIEL
ncbi:MAG: hypothetical protein J5749_05710 [Lachnospiraceae bacterium]|nr:hypothetical protein [Lachnospiraceae bacterium]